MSPQYASSDFPDTWIPAPFFGKPRLRETIQTTAPGVQVSQDHYKCFVDHSHVTMSKSGTSLLEGLGEEEVPIHLPHIQTRFPQIIPPVLELIPCSSETPCIYRFLRPSPCSRSAATMLGSTSYPTSLMEWVLRSHGLVECKSSILSTNPTSMLHASPSLPSVPGLRRRKCTQWHHYTPGRPRCQWAESAMRVYAYPTH